MLGINSDTYKQRHLEAQLIRQNQPQRTWRTYVLARRDQGASAPNISREIYAAFKIQVDQKTVLRWIKQAEEERERALAKPPKKGEIVRLNLK